MKALALVAFLVGLVGCQVQPAATVTAGAVGLSQAGPVQVPARAETITARASIPLPKGTEIRVVPVMPAEKSGAVPPLAFVLPESAPLSIETVADRVTGPQSFTPPAPPTPEDEADGRARMLYRIGLPLGIALAVFGLVRGWDFVMYGGAAISAGCAFGLFVQSHPFLFAVLGIGAAAAVIGPAFYHFKLKKLQPEKIASSQ